MTPDLGKLKQLAEDALLGPWGETEPIDPSTVLALIARIEALECWARDALVGLEGQATVARTKFGDENRLWDPEPLIRRAANLLGDRHE